jgi:FMN phosphatase YigB (HAD superfamily)
MIKAVLLDLDDTLLHNPDSIFVPAYLTMADTYFADYWQYPGISKALLQAVQAFASKRDMQHTNSDIAYNIITHVTERTIDVVQKGFFDFYRSAYPALRQHVKSTRTALALINCLREQKLSVVIATNPIYPAEAIRQRLAWAGIPDQLTDYALVTHADNMHFAKPDPAFFAEIIARLGVEPDEAIMVGDSLRNDILPAQEIGLHTYHIVESPKIAQGESEGTLNQFYESIQRDDWIDLLHARPLTPEMIEPEMRGNVGALFGILQSVKSHFWTQHPDPNEWSLIQVVCHLLESEQTVQRPRLQRIRAEDNPFIAAPKPPPGPREAGVCDEDGLQTAERFLRERLITLEFLRGLSPQDWSRPARHSIFGPTSLLEMAHFTAQHDRLHINQLCQTIGRCT